MTQLSEQDEMTLMDFWRVLKKRQRLALSVFLLVSAISILYVVFVPRTYESEASIYIGQLNGTSLEPPAPIIERLQSRYGREHARLAGEQDWLSKVAQDRQDGRMIHITSLAKSPDEAQKLAQKAVDEVVGAHQKRFDAQAQRISGEIRVFEELLSSGRSSLEATKKMKASTEQRFNVLGAIYSSVELAAIQKRIGELQDAASGVKTSATEVIKAPTFPKRAASPKVALTLLAGLILSVVLSVAVALVAEFAFANDGAEANSKRR